MTQAFDAWSKQEHLSSDISLTAPLIFKICDHLNQIRNRFLSFLALFIPRLPPRDDIMNLVRVMFLCSAKYYGNKYSIITFKAAVCDSTKFTFKKCKRGLVACGFLKELLKLQKRLLG